MLGDKEITVRIRSNSHYRISAFSGQVGMLIVLRLVEILLGKVESRGVQGYGSVSFFARPSFREGRFLFYPFDFENKKKGKTMKRILSLILTLVIVCLLAVSCNTLEKSGFGKLFGKNDEQSAQTPSTGNPSEEAPEGLWKSATYLKDTELGTGSKTIYVEVKVEDKSVTFTIHTDKSTLGDALLEHNLINGEAGMYGLYVKTVNGMLADYDIDASYWSFYKGGEMMMTGVDGESIAGGEHYEIVYAK